MRTKPATFFFGFSLFFSASSLHADGHRVLILDALREFGPPPFPAEILVCDVDSSKTVAKTQVGPGPEIGLSPKGDTVALLTSNLVGGRAQPNARLQTFRTSDLSEVEKGLIPVVPRGGFQRYPIIPSIAFSPDGQEIIIQRIYSYENDEKPVRYTVHNISLNFLKRELDQGGKFKLARREVIIPRGTVALFLGTSKWPKLSLWNAVMGALEEIDVRTGTVLSRLPFDYGDDPLFQRLDPTYLEQPNIGELALHLGANGGVISGGHYAYYIPEPIRNPKGKPGFIKKIDLHADPPKIILQSDQRQENLTWASACVSEAGGAMLVALKKQGMPRKPSGQVRIYSTDSLKLQNEIQLSISSCDKLEASWDGKYAYALDRNAAKLAVIDIAAGKEVKVLNNIGKIPAVVLALP
jgi:hypothetical protein